MTCHLFVLSRQQAEEQHRQRQAEQARSDLHSLPGHILAYAALPVPQVHGHASQAQQWVITVKVVHEVPLCGFESRQRPEHVGQRRIV